MWTPAWTLDTHISFHTLLASEIVTAYSRKGRIDIITRPRVSVATQYGDRSAGVAILTRSSIQPPRKWGTPRYFARPRLFITRLFTHRGSFEWSKSPVCFGAGGGGEGRLIAGLDGSATPFFWRSDGSVSQLSVRPLLWPSDVSIHHRAHTHTCRVLPLCLRAEGALLCAALFATLCGKNAELKKMYVHRRAVIYSSPYTPLRCDWSPFFGRNISGLF